MKKITQKWLEYAKGDLEGAKILLDSAKGDYSYLLAIWHCHQAIEKILKAVIIEKGKEVKKVHNLIFLLEESQLEVPKEFREFIEELNPYYQPIRYPDIPYKGPLLKWNKKLATKYFENAQEIFLWIQEKLTSKK